MNVFQFFIICKRTNNANNATHYVKLGKKRRESSKRNYYIISPGVIIKAIIIIDPKWNCQAVDYLKVVFNSWKTLCSNMIITTSNPSYLELLGLFTVHTHVSTNARLSLQL